MKFISILLLSMFLTAATDKAKTFQVKSIGSESDDQSSLVSIRYKKGVPSSKVKVEEHGTFIQIRIPQTVVMEPGTFYDGNSPYFRKVAAFQIDESTVGVRLFVTQETKSLVSSLSTEFLSDRLLIHLDHKTIKPVHIDDSPPVEEIIARTEVRNDIKDPAVEMKLIDEPKPSAASMSDDLKDKLSYITVVAAIFMMLMIASVMIKKYRFRSKSGPSEVSEGHLRTLASHKLAPKQSVTLIEVGKQKVLLGVSPDGISYLTSIDENKNQAPAPAPAPAPAHTMVREPLVPRLQQKADFDRQQGQNLRSSVPNKTLESLTEKDTLRKKQPAKSKSTSPALERMLSSDESSGVRTKFSSQKTEGDSKSIEDVTNLIRSKLKNLPSV